MKSQESSPITKFPTAEEFLAEFSDLGNLLVGGFTQLANKLVAVLDVNPKFRYELIEKGKGRISRENINLLERFGRGQLDSRLLQWGGPASKELQLLPKSEQTRAFDEGVQVLDLDEQNHRLIALEELSTAQKNQVFSKTGLRSLTEQRTWLQKKKAEKSPVMVQEDYRVKKDHVEILKDGAVVYKITKKRWLQIAAEFE